MRSCGSRSLLWLLLLLLAGGSGARGQQTARQRAADRQFLLNRGISLDPAKGALTSPVEALLAARKQQQALVTKPVPTRRFGVNRSTALVQPSLSSDVQTWQPLGPMQVNTPAYGLVTGRISSLAVDGSDPTGGTVYLGATGGGVWKSSADPQTGKPIFHALTDNLPVFQGAKAIYPPSLSIGSLSLNPNNNQMVLAGTGDPNDALDSYYGVGILRSTDGGSTWSQITRSSDGNPYNFAGSGIAGFAWSTATPNLVVMAVSQSLEGQIVGLSAYSKGMPEAGLYYSNDAGQTWKLSTITDGTNQVIQSGGSVSSPAQPPGNPATSVIWNKQRGVFFAAVRFHGYYSSPDGVTWTRLAKQPGTGLTVQNCPARPNNVGSISCPIFRGVLAVQPATGDTFALTTDLNNKDQGLYQDVCSTSGLAVSQCNTSTTPAWGTRRNTSALEDGTGVIAGADYNLALSAVASQQDTILFAGTEDLFRCSLANSCTWRNTTNTTTCNSGQVAPSVHAIDGSLGATGTVYFGTDGGLWRTTDTLGQTGPVCSANDASHFDNLNGGLGSLAEVSHLAATPNNGSLVLAGMGALGIASSASGTGVWQQLLDGEGSFVAIDPITPGNWFADAFPGLGIYTCPNGANCDAAGFGASPAIARAQVQNDSDYLVNPAPWILDPGNPANILLGTCRMWRGPAGGGWTGSNLLSVPLDGAGGSFCNGNAAVRSLGAGGSYNAGGERVYAGITGPVDGGASVPGHIYGATVPQGGGVVSWTDLWRNPVTNQNMNQQFNPTGAAISTVTVDPSDVSGRTVYLGIAGFPQGQGGIVYRSTDGGATWANLTNSLPIAPINKVVVDPGNPNVVYLAGDMGVYWTNNIANCVPRFLGYQACWTQLGAGLPNAPVTDLQVVNNNGRNALEAGTYGRGIWTLGLTTSTVPAQATLSPGSTTFDPAGVGTPSANTRSFTLVNTGSAPLVIAQIAVSPSDYAQTNNCGASLAAGASCAITVSFTPGALGDRPGTLNVFANTQAGKLTASLDGTGQTPGHLTVTPTSLNFPTTATGDASAPMSVTLSNDGGALVQLTPRTIAGTNASEFALATGGSCGNSLSSGATCTVPVTFQPSNTGTRAAVLNINSSANSPTVALSGTAVLPAHLTLTPSGPFSFEDTGKGNQSRPQTITVRNTGGAAAQLGAATISADYQIPTNTCGAALLGNQTCAVTIVFSPSQTGSRPGLFTQPASNIPAGQVTASLSGTGLPAPVVALAPNPLDFGSQQQGTTSAVKQINLSNSGGSPAQFSAAPAITGDPDFAIVSNTCGSALGPGMTCGIGITFTPSQPNQRPSAQLTVAFGSNGPATAILTGTGTAPASLALSPGTVTFPATAAGTTSAAQSLLVRNLGQSAATVNTPALTGPFAVSGTDCPLAPQTLGSNGQCTISLTFTPPGIAAYAGAITLTGSFTNSPSSVALQGQGAAPPNATIDPASDLFPDTPQGAPSPARTFTVTSTGGVPVTLSAPAVSTADFYVGSSDCPASLSPGQHCTAQVVFHPSAQGAKSAFLRFTTNTLGGTLAAGLSGTGTAPGVLTLSPSALHFGPQVISGASTSQTATVSNTGGSAVKLGTIAVSPEYTIQSSTCGATLSPATSCTLNVAFSPTAAGSRTGLLTVPGDGNEAFAVTTLDGTGLIPGSLSFSPSSLAFGDVATDASIARSTTVTNTGSTPVHVSSISATGDFSVTGGTCAANGTVQPNQSCTVEATFSPARQGNSTGALTLTNDGKPGYAIAPLSGNGIAPGSLTLAPSNITFGAVATGAAAPSQTVRLTNNGGVSVLLASPTVSGNGFVYTPNDCGVSLAPGASCTVQIGFRPQRRGLASGAFSVSWQDGGRNPAQSAQTALAGNGVNPGALMFSPAPAQFGTVVVGASATQSVVVRNTGDLPVAIGVPFTSNGYRSASQCGSSLVAGASCTVQVSFAPSTRGPQAGLLTVAAADGSGTWTDLLGGTGVSPGTITATPANLTFPRTIVGSSSASEVVTFSNSGDVSQPLSQAQSSSPEYVLTQNNCTASLGPNNSCTVSIAFVPAARGDRRATLTLAGSNTGGPVARVTLDGAGLAPAQLAFSPAALNFGTQAENTRTQTPQTLTLTNTGDAPTQLGLPVLSGQYVLASNDSCVDGTTGNGVQLQGGASCTLGVQFQPTARGTLKGALTVSDVSGVISATANLSGTGRALTLDPAILVFDKPLLLGQSYTSPTLISITNLDRTQAITLQPLSITGDFAMEQSSCGSTLPPDTACSLYISFKPIAGGRRTGAFTVSDGTESQTTQLVGIGLTPATDTLSATSLAFPATTIGLSSAAQSVTITNSGDAALMQISAVTTANNRPFSVVNNCGPSLPGHSSCSLAVQFIPQSVGTVGGTLTVTDALGTHVVTLTGQGTLPPISAQATPPLPSPAGVDFGPYANQAATQPQIVTINNRNRVQMTSLATTVDGPEYTISSSTCSGALDPGASCQIALVFKPVTAGVHPGTLHVSGVVNDYPESTSVTLSGAGEDFGLAVVNATATAADKATVVITQGQEADFNITITSIGDASAYPNPSTVSIACTGVPANATCLAPASISVPPGGAQGTGVLRIVTNGIASSTAHPANRWWPKGAALALLCPILLLRGENRRRFLVCALAALLIASPVACGVHASGVNGKSAAQAGQTPTGTYTITVTGSFPGAQRTATVQLVVQ